MMLCCYLSEGHCATVEMYCSAYRVPKKQDTDRKLRVVLLVDDVMLLSFRGSLCHPRDVLFCLPDSKEAGPRQETGGWFYWLMMLCCYLSEGYCAILEMYCSAYRVSKKQDPDKKLRVVLLVDDDRLLCCYLSEGHCATLEMYCSAYRVPKKQESDRKLRVVIRDVST